jgi:hypothetical protein
MLDDVLAPSQACVASDRLCYQRLHFPGKASFYIFGFAPDSVSRAYRAYDKSAIKLTC